jgi:hypothetical protein
MSVELELTLYALALIVPPITFIVPFVAQGVIAAGDADVQLVLVTELPLALVRHACGEREDDRRDSFGAALGDDGAVVPTELAVVIGDGAATRAVHYQGRTTLLCYCLNSC